MATIDDIIKVSRVSRSTVQRFLAGQSIRADNERKIKNAMKELNYRTDKISEKRDCIIEILGNSVGGVGEVGGFMGFTDLVVSMTKAIEKSGATVQLQSGYNKYIPRADGVIVFGLRSDREDEIISILKSRNVPFVFAYREIERPGVSFVTVDNYPAAYEMTETFIKKGHTKIACCGDTANEVPILRNMKGKLEGYKDCLKDYKISLPDKYICKTFKEEDYISWMRELLETEKDLTAFFGLRDKAAFDFIEIAKEYGKRVPEDIAVAGMDGSAEAVYAGLTSVTIPFDEIGTECVKTIFELIDNPNAVCIRKYLKYDIAIRKTI